MNSYDEDTRALSDTLIYELTKALSLSQSVVWGRPSGHCSKRPRSALQNWV